MNMAAPEYPAPTFDMLRLPLVGRLLLRPRGRLILQLPLLGFALLLIYDGFTGSPLAAQNLATIAPWVHYRGLVIVALLLVGNLFCMGCPFTLPRTLARRLSIRGRRFPQRLRSKWLAIGGLFTLFFLYEWLDLWASPALTAWVIVAYFVLSFILEAVFTESAFCKYICPLGSFNFVYSTVSPLRIGVRSQDVCRTCVGKECINGSYSPQPVILIDSIGVDGRPERTHTHDANGVLGCGTLLFAPQVTSNLDCTMCLDCARACPHENAGLFARQPAAELLSADAWPRRYDVAFLVICLAFMGLVNAFGMVPPVYVLMQDVAAALGLTRLGLPNEIIEGVILLLMFAVGGVILPVGLSLSAAAAARSLTGTRRRDSLRIALSSFAPAFVPIGLGFWAAHYGFHFLVGLWSIIPAAVQFLLDHGITFFGQPDWSQVGVSDAGVIGLLQTVALLSGFAGSMIIAQRISGRMYGARAVNGLLPWALLFVAMMLAGMYLFSLPMEMRGTVLFD